jgi:asparaginyl-tRNA synthetase
MIAYSIAQLFANNNLVNTSVTVKGWIRTRRDSKAGISFLTIADGSCFATLQAVASDTLVNYQQEVLNLTSGCSVIVTGVWIASSGQGQAFELKVQTLEVVGWVDDPLHYPLAPKRHSLEYLREIAHLRPRTNIISAVTRVRHCIAQAIHRFFHEQGFFWISTPIITASDCEGAGELFRVSSLDLMNLPQAENGQIDFSQDFFGRETYLTVSGQLNVEAYCLAMSKVYTFGPTFRAENSNTSRHLAEFWMVEPEIAFADLTQNAHLAEALLKYIAQAVLNEREDDLGFFSQWVDKQCVERLTALAAADFVHMEYSEAIEILLKTNKTFEFPVHWGIDMQSEHERYITEEWVGKPVVVMNYPKEIKAFYMRQNDDGKTVAAMDVLAPGIGEIIGGSQREERLEKLDQRMNELHVNQDHLQWYRDLRRYGSVPHAGFGLGLERLISYVTGVANVRDVIPFPRTPKNAAF